MELKLISRAMSERCDAGTLDDVRQVLGELFSRLDIDQYAFINAGSSVRYGGSATTTGEALHAGLGGAAKRGSKPPAVTAIPAQRMKRAPRHPRRCGPACAPPPAPGPP
jgi:hypothetical protein